MGERKFSCIKQVVNTVQIPLPATFITNEIAGIAEILESWKRQYKKQLQGVVVNYRHYSLSSSSGFIAANKPFVYYNITATFDLFCPKVGDIVKGKINRISNEHIGCLIEDTINVTIHLSKYSNDESLPFINLNREILFEITYFSYDRKEIRVTGKITPKCIQLMKDLFPPVAFNNLVDTRELSNNTDEGIGTSSECTDDGQLNHAFDDSQFNNEENFKKPFSSTTEPKKKSVKRLKNSSESSSMDTSDVSSSFEKPKKKKKRKDKSDSKMEIDAIDNNLLSDSITCKALIENFSNFNHDDILGAIKDEELPIEDTTIVKKHKKKRKNVSSPLAESALSNNQSFHEDTTSAVFDTSVEKVKVSKKRKRESESSFMDTSEQSTADEMPKKKKKIKDKTALTSHEEIEKELRNLSVDDPGVLSIKKEKLSKNNSVSEGKKKKKNKDKKVKDKKKEKKSKDKDKSKKKKGKGLASGSVLKKDKKANKKAPKKNKLDGEKSKKHHKKSKSEKKKKGKSKSKVPDVIKSEVD